ncbi:MAG: GDP-mannose 4,6-dehydratase, partial [Candidatus Omnitrophica bacterium]|nr:GDP-mannose 4,6-dehydratase [Candidatus Omnitrophota bacterium]
IDIIFHLAAEAIVGRSQENPLNAFKSNITGTWEVLEASRRQKNAPAIVIASSDKAYGEHKKLPYKEGAALIANHPYDVSKSCADLIANTYAHTYGLPVAITRSGNIYGPGDFNFSRLIPDAIRCILSGKTLKIRSNGKFIRDYVYIDDVVQGYVRIAELLAQGRFKGEAFNLSNERPLSVMKVLEEIKRPGFSDKQLEYKIMNTARYEIKKQYLSSAKARRVLGWRPKYGIREGFKKTVDWYSVYLRKGGVSLKGDVSVFRRKTETSPVSRL